MFIGSGSSHVELSLHPTDGIYFVLGADFIAAIAVSFHRCISVADFERVMAVWPSMP